MTSKDKKKKVSILGTRGIPANHGGFETFAEKLSLYLHGNGWEVTVYCQETGHFRIREGCWQGVKTVCIATPLKGSLGSTLFDVISTVHASIHRSMKLTLGYNTAVLTALFRLRGYPNIINMDGLEWKRTKWGIFARVWLFFNERLGCWLASTLIADHPEVARRLLCLTPRKFVSMIPYGADEIITADQVLLKPWGLQPNGFALLVARIEPENSILEMVRAFSARSRNLPFLVVGPFDPENNPYHARIRAAASPEVLFLGPIFERETLSSLRFFARLYLHGHTVGGTNPTLVEAMACGSPILAHANPFNRWVAGQGAVYFANEEECRAYLDQLLIDEDMLKSLGEKAKKRFLENFRWPRILQAYEKLCCQFA